MSVAIFQVEKFSTLESCRYLCTHKMRNARFGIVHFGTMQSKIVTDMRFFDRTEEIAKLKEIEQRSHDTAQFTVITGRRSIGKTSLVRETPG